MVYADPLELVAMVVAISLAFHGRRADAKVQEISDQHAVSKASRLRVIEMKGEEDA